MALTTTTTTRTTNTMEIKTTITSQLSHKDMDTSIIISTSEYNKDWIIIDQGGRVAEAICLPVELIPNVIKALQQHLK